MLEKSTVVKGLMSKEWEWSSITERSTELIPKLVGQNGISVSTMVISEMEKKRTGYESSSGGQRRSQRHVERELNEFNKAFHSDFPMRDECITTFLAPSR